MNIVKFLKNDKVNNLLKYSSIKYIALIIGFVKGIVNARVLGPELLGVIGTLLLILSYLGYSNLGIVYSMNREYVIYESNSDIKGAKKVIGTSFTVLLILSILLFTIGLGISFFYKGDMGKYLLLIFIIGALEQFRTFYVNYFRLVNDFRKINFIELISNVLSFILIIIFIRYYQVYSILISMLIADVIIFIFGFRNSGKIKISIDVAILRNLIIIGIPLLVYNLGFYILSTIDRLMIVKFLGYKDLGYYTFSNQIVGATLVFVTSVLFLYYPKAIKNLNINNVNNTKEVLARTEQYTKYVEVFGVVLCATGIILIKPFVDVVVPKFDISINTYRILVLGTIANQVAYFSNVFIVSNKKQIYLIYLQIVTVILAIIFCFIFIKLDFGIIGVSIASLITNTIYSIMQQVIYLRILNIRKGLLKNIIKIYAKFIIYMVICVILSLLNLNFILYSSLIIVVTTFLYFKDLLKTIKDIGNV